MLLASSRDRTYLRITVAGSVINVSANLIAIPTFGMIGAATVTMATEVFVFAFIALCHCGVSPPRSFWTPSVEPLCQLS